MAQVFIPLNRFQSVVATLTGEQDEIYTTPNGVSTIVLSAQITNNNLTENLPVTIFVDSNVELPVPNFEGLELTSSFDSASALLTLNRQFIRKETAAYINFLNSTSETPFSFTASRFETIALETTDAVAYDILNQKTIRTNKRAKDFYSKNGVLEILTAEYSSSIFALQYVNTLAQQVIRNQSVTGSLNVDRLYQNTFTQSFDSTYITTGSLLSGSSYLVEQLIDVILETIESPNLVAQPPVQLVTNVIIPPADSLSPVVAGKLVLEQGYGFVISGSTELSVILSLLESANE